MNYLPELNLDVPSKHQQRITLQDSMNARGYTLAQFIKMAEWMGLNDG